LLRILLSKLSGQQLFQSQRVCGIVREFGQNETKQKMLKCIKLWYDQAQEKEIQKNDSQQQKPGRNESRIKQIRFDYFPYFLAHALPIKTRGVFLVKSFCVWTRVKVSTLFLDRYDVARQRFFTVSTFPVLYDEGRLRFTFQNLKFFSEIHYLKEEENVSIFHELFRLLGGGFSTDLVTNFVNHLFQNLFSFIQHVHKREFLMAARIKLL
jgi:hypothetical protein